MPEAGDPDGGAPRSVDLDWRSIAALAASLAALVILTGLARSVPRTLAVLAVATILTLGLDPLVGMLSRRLPGGRGAAMVTVLVGFAAAVVAIGLLLVPPAVRQARDLTKDLPHVLSDLTSLPVVGSRLADAGVPDKLQRTIEQLPDRLLGNDTPLLRIGRRAADGIVIAAVVLLFVVTLLLDGARLVGGARRLVPEERRYQADRIGDLVYRVVGRYVAGSLLVAVVAGVCTLIAGLVLGVPLAPLAAVWVMVWDLVPQIGGAAGGIPFVLLGFTHGAGTGLACAAFFVVYLQLENNVLGPLLVGQAVKLSPPATMTAALIGVSAGGVVGALLAVPTLGAAKAIYLELRPPEAGPPVPPELEEDRASPD